MKHQKIILDENFHTNNNSLIKDESISFEDKNKVNFLIILSKDI